MSEENGSGLKIRPVAVELKVVAELQKDGKCVEHVVAQDKINEINFNGATLQAIIDKAQKALEEKYGVVT